MRGGSNIDFLLTAIVPVTDFRSRVDFLAAWLKLINNFPLKVELILDTSDPTEIYLFDEFILSLKSIQIIVHKVNFSSPGCSRNIGIAQAVTPYVTFWDSDDLPNLSEIFDTIQSGESLSEIIIGQYETTNESNFPKAISVSDEWSLQEIMCKNPGIWRMIFPTYLIKTNIFSNYRMAEDQLFLAKLEISNLNYRFANQVFYKYVNHDHDRLTQNQEALKDLIPVLNELILIIRAQRHMSREISIIIFLRLTISSIKNLPRKYLFRLLIILTKIMFHPRYLKDIIKAIVNLLRIRIKLN